MFNNNFGKKIKTILLTLFISTMFILCAGCGSKNLSYNDKINNARESLVSVTIKADVKDGEAYVYGYEKAVVVKDNGEFDCTITETKLSPSFELVEDKETETISGDRNGLLQINLDEELMTEPKDENDTLMFTASLENVARIFNIDEVQGWKDINFKVDFTKKTLLNLECSFKVESGKNVSIKITCEY